MGRKLKTQTDLSLKLAKRIKEELGIEVDPIIHRLYPGYIQRWGGAWSWFMFRKVGIGDVGSQDTATKVLKSKKWETIKQSPQCEIIVPD